MIYINEIVEIRCIIDGEKKLEKGVMSKRTIIYYFSKEYKIQDEKTLGRLSDIAFIKKVNHRDILLKQGEIPECLLFQIKGIIGGYHVDEKGKCHMELFSGQYKLPISVTYRPKDTSSLTLEALTKGEVIVVPKDAFWELALESEEMMKLNISMLLNALNLQTELRRALIHYDIKKRYEWFLKEYSEINGKISDRYIASFLNMTPESLSRVKKELQGEKESNIKSGETNEKETG